VQEAFFATKDAHERLKAVAQLHGQDFDERAYSSFWTFQAAAQDLFSAMEKEMEK
jgi:hypothetical protein